MPTNLPPEYFEAEKRYKAAESPAEKAACLEDLIGTIPKHKGTDKLRADLRRRLSKLKSAAQGPKGAGRHVSAYQLDKEGAGQVAVVGCANVGKSALVDTLTNATPGVSPAPFSTWEPTPGMMPVENVQIQLIDTPPLNPEYVEPELMDLIRRVDLILLVVDLQADAIQQLEDALTILEEHRVWPQHLAGQHPDPQRMFFIPTLVLVNKHDDPSFDEDFEIFGELLEGEWPLLSASAATGHNLECLKQKLFEQLDIVRVYSRAPGQEPDFQTPFVLKRGSTVEEFAGKIHKDFLENMKAARVWGSATYDGQLVSRDHVLSDGDIVELHI